MPPLTPNAKLPESYTIFYMENAMIYFETADYQNHSFEPNNFLYLGSKRLIFSLSTHKVVLKL